ncbi:hypothetical protein K438DRAFT_1561209 [Mycena galopus ATCC 62051]|nr:hypothetical protein K438DRAFT_1561209 [Mycena galopus ATCC 62051]
MPQEKANRIKRRRLQGSCDTCRKRKGDSAEMPGNRCTPCLSSKIECTHIGAKVRQWHTLGSTHP